MPRTRGGRNNRTQRILAECRKMVSEGTKSNDENKENESSTLSSTTSVGLEKSISFDPPVRNEFQTFFNTPENTAFNISTKATIISEFDDETDVNGQILMDLEVPVVNDISIAQDENGSALLIPDAKILFPAESLTENASIPTDRNSDGEIQIHMDSEVSVSIESVMQDGYGSELPMNDRNVYEDSSLGLTQTIENGDFYMTNERMQEEDLEIQNQDMITDEHKPTDDVNNEDENNSEYDDHNNNVVDKMKKPFSIQKVKTRKRNRNSGKQYVTAKGKIKKPREMKPLRTNCRNKCRNVLDEEVRQTIFREYWSLGEYDKRVAFVASLISAQDKKITRMKVEGKSTKNRTYSYVYSLEIKGSKHIVCKTCFLNTLGETEKFVSVALSKKLSTTCGITEPDRRGKHVPSHKTPQFKINQVNEHILSFPAYESHYSGRHTSKKYLASSLNLSTMYKLYCEKYPDQPVSIKIYSQEFHKTGLKFKKPKNDTCTKCDTLHSQLKIANSEEDRRNLNDQLTSHQLSADLAYKSKENDKKKGLDDPSVMTYAFDLEQVLPTPYLSTNKMFYLRQLSTYNLTVHNCISGESGHYMWPESTAGRGGNEVASCLFRFLNSIPESVKIANFYSDTCGGQNKNFIVNAMYQYALNLHPSLEEINHKFLVPGHTHMECDVDHSVIERAKKKSPFEIQVPRDWYQLVRIASKKNKFKVFVMECEHFFSFSEMTGKGPFQKKSFRMRDVCWLRYTKGNEKVQYKFSLSEEEEFEEIGFFRKGKKLQNLSGYELNRLNNGPKPINPKKKANLMEIANLLDKDVQEFYKNLAVEKITGSTADTDPDIDRYFSDDED
ncbi:unnamed protein product [Phaedon cochleariae]|uniref:DUF7869 domain-containing protein n=1 Tax=Phaedon cochleariae TaxID=80249 RepID=A0A9P0DHE3_PHACE|nr:unnamed protein product [Phaedon cochleariae]